AALAAMGEASTMSANAHGQYVSSLLWLVVAYISWLLEASPGALLPAPRVHLSTAWSRGNLILGNPARLCARAEACPPWPLLVNRLAYDLRVPFTSVRLWARADPARGDVVVFPSAESGVTLVKRVIAVPGDEIAVREGRVSLNGRQVALKAGGAKLIEQLAGH